MQRRISDDAFTEPDARHIALLAEMDGQLDLELEVVVEDEDPERPVVDDPLGQLRDARKQLIEIEDGRDFPSDLRQRFERFCVEPALFVELGVDERDGDVRRNLAQRSAVSLLLK